MAGALSNRPGYFVLFARLPNRAGPYSFRHTNRSGRLALVDHKPGGTWTDQTGETLTTDALETNEIAIWPFATKADAVAAYDPVKLDVMAVPN